MPEAQNPAPAPVVDGRIGQVVSGRYRIQQLLGEGGMGAVYLAEHTHMKKRVALKLLHAEMSQNPEVSARFEREAVAAAHIEHPNVAAATDFGKTDDGSFFLVLEYLEGTNLRDAVAAGPLGIARALHISRQIALALDRAHEQGIVHRDLKPENVMLVRRDDDPDFVKVLDFGVAKVTDAAMAERAAANPSQPLTRLGTVIGTPEYMAPEQALGEAVTAESDLYAVGVMLYEMLTGLHPFQTNDRVAMLSFHIVAPVPAMKDRAPGVDVPPEVEGVVRSLLEKEAKKRPSSGKALAAAIEAAAFASGLDIGSSTPAPRASLAQIPAASSSQRLVAAPPSERNLPLTTAETPKSISADAFAKTSLGQPAASVVPAEGASSGGGPLAPVIAKMRPAIDKAIAFAKDFAKTQPRHVVIGVSAAVPLFLVLVVVLLVLALRGPKAPGASGLAAGSTEETSESATPKVKTAPPEQLKAAATQGADAVEGLAKEFPDDPAVKRQLALSYHQAGRAAEAMAAVKTLVAADPKAADDEELVKMVSATAAKNTKGTDDPDDEAFGLLESSFGERGVDALVELSKSSSWALKSRAAKSLQKPDVKAHASPAAAVYLDFGASQSCGQKHDLLGRAKESGDARLLPTLKALKPTNGCRRGLFKRVDCWPCLREDGSLDDAIAAIEARAGTK